MVKIYIKTKNYKEIIVAFKDKYDADRNLSKSSILDIVNKMELKGEFGNLNKGSKKNVRTSPIKRRIKSYIEE